MIRSHQSTSDSVSVAEFFRAIPDGQKADLINGEIWMASPDSPRADDLHLFVAGLMRYYVTSRKLGGKAFGSRVAFVLDDRNAPEPDVAFVVRERLHLVQSGRVAGPPDIAVEITCDESDLRDRQDKFRLYEQAGVREYWIVDPNAHRVDAWVLRDGKFDIASLIDGHILHSEVIPGFWLDTRWLFAEPLPDDADCLRTILGEH